MNMKTSNILLLLLNAYFMVMCLTVERCYCADPITPDDTRFLMQAAYAYGKENNPLFMHRPEWLRKATCLSSYGFFCGYLLISLTALTDSWDKHFNNFIITIFVGAKTYGVMFYHIMEFTDPEFAPFDSLVGYWAAEAPYLIGIAITIMNLINGRIDKDKAKVE